MNDVPESTIAMQLSVRFAVLNSAHMSTSPTSASVMSTVQYVEDTRATYCIGSALYRSSGSPMMRHDPASFGDLIAHTRAGMIAQRRNTRHGACTGVRWE
jgi:hypothetical protein